MRYVSAINDPDVRAELESDLSGLIVGSAFLLASPEQIDDILTRVDKAAQEEYRKAEAGSESPTVQAVTLDMGRVIGFNSLIALADLPDNSVTTQSYRYFDTPREAIVNATIAAPHEIKKTQEITFFCGPDRRKTGDYRVFSLHPGPKRQPFANRYQPEAERRQNRDYWDRHSFMSTPNQVIASVRNMRTRYAQLEPEARDRVFHLSRSMISALHKWYGTWDQVQRSTDRSNSKGEYGHGDFELLPDGTMYYFMSKANEMPPDMNNIESLLPRLSNSLRPAIIRADGSEEFYLNGVRHREGGPAVLEPQPDGGWIEMWYEEGLISRPPEEGPAKIVYDATGKIIEEVSYYRGGEVESAVLGAASDAVKLMQGLIKDTTEKINAFINAPDYRLLRGQIDLAVSRQKVDAAQIVRAMSQEGEQVGLRWDFDHLLEQDPRVQDAYQDVKKAIKNTADSLIEASRAMRFTNADDAHIINAIWGKINRDIDRMIEQGYNVPGEPGTTAIDDFVNARNEAKKLFQTVSDMGKAFSATGK